MLTPRIADMVLDHYPLKEDLLILREAIDRKLTEQGVVR